MEGGIYPGGLVIGWIFCLPVFELILGPGGLIIKRQCTVFASKGILVSDHFPSLLDASLHAFMCLQLFLRPIEFHGPYVLIFLEALRIPRK